MPKKRLKKKVLYGGVITLILLILGIVFGIKTYKEYKYKQTYEYKLISHGYSKENALSLIDFYQDNEKIEYILTIPRNDNILNLIKEKYYINDNLERYLTYLEKNNDKDLKDIISIVNVNRDYDYYDNDIETNVNDGIALIVNKYYKLSSDYVPEDLVDISIRYAYSNNQIVSTANDAYVSMWNAANEDGYKLIVNSSFRDYQEQEDVYNSMKISKGEKEADKVAARPGYSEHQTGLAIDVFEINNQSTTTFKESPAYTWLKENAYKYGFIERFPEGKEYLTGYNAEAWHWRYVGEDIAKIIHNEQITFDEYYAYYIEKHN